MKKEVTDIDYSYEWLMNPISRESFFNEYFEKKTLHIPRTDKAYYSRLLSLESIEDFLYSQVVKFPSVRMTKLKQDIPPDKYVMGERVIPSQLIKYFSEGATIILSGLNDFIPTLGLFCSYLTKDFGHRFQTNIYITPAHSQGFDIHYDDHDVLILQIKGNKKWRLYKDNPVELPHKLLAYEKDKYTPGPIDQELILNEGELLYIPRGVMHDADSLDEMSIHITLGYLGYTWTDLLVEGILDLSKKNAEIRKFVPSDFMTGAKNSEDFAKEIEHVFKEVKDNLILNEIRDRMKIDLLRTQRNNIRGMLTTALNIDTINAKTSFSVNKCVNVFVTTTTENVILEWAGKKVEFPAFALPAIKFLTNGVPAAFTQSEIPECMDEAGKIALLKRLTKEGYLTITQQN